MYAQYTAEMLGNTSTFITKSIKHGTATHFVLRYACQARQHERVRYFSMNHITDILEAEAEAQQRIDAARAEANQRTEEARQSVIQLQHDLEQTLRVQEQEALTKHAAELEQVRQKSLTQAQKDASEIESNAQMHMPAATKVIIERTTKVL